MMSDRIPTTRAGYEKLKAELHQLEHVELPKILQRVADARAEGDLTENAEYDGARESMRMMEARIAAMRDRLSRTMIVDPTQSPRDCVGFGATVVVKDLEFGDREEFTLVGAGEEDYDAGRILASSPLAMGLTGKKVGDRVEIAVPQGVLKFEILEIRFEDL
jgi:transcription elongation factor GreA